MVAAAAEEGGERRGARGGGAQALVVSLALAASTAPGAGAIKLTLAKGGSDCTRAWRVGLAVSSPSARRPKPSRCGRGRTAVVMARPLRRPSAPLCRWQLSAAVCSRRRPAQLSPVSLP